MNQFFCLREIIHPPVRLLKRARRGLRLAPDDPSVIRNFFPPQLNLLTELSRRTCPHDPTDICANVSR